VVPLTSLLIAPAERADVIVDFTNVPVGTNIILKNVGPDSPFGGGLPGVNFPAANPATTGQVMQFQVVAINGTDPSTPVASITLPTLANVGTPTATEYLSLNEMMSMTVYWRKSWDITLGLAIITEAKAGRLFGPTMAMLGTFDPAAGVTTPLHWGSPVTETPTLGSTEMWEIHNFTADAHPIHIHLVMFQVVERVDAKGVVRGPEVWETGYKDTVIAYPGEITRVKAVFDTAGLFVWHCHILEHEDNEMMRPYEVILP
jgi:bilirubin oxidase